MTMNISTVFSGPLAYWGGLLLTFLMTLSCGVIAAHIFWIILAGTDWNTRSDAFMPEPSALGSRRDLTILERNTPFRVILTTPADLSAQDGQLANTPETRLKLTLHGFRLDGDAETSIAVISSETQSQQHYRVGDPIKGLSDVYLVRIFADGVVIERQGENEWLPKVSKEEGGRILSIGSNDKVPGLVAEAGPGRPENAGPEVETQTIGESVPDGSTPDIPVNLVEAEIRQDELLLLAESLRFTPSSGSFGSGYAIYPTKNLELFSRAGLRAGDVILSVNGIELTVIEDVDAALASIAGRSRVEASLLRGEERINLLIVSQ